MHVALNEYTDVVLLSLRDILLLCLHSKDSLQVQSRVPLGCVNDAIHNRSSDPFLEVMVKKLKTLLRDVGVGMQREVSTKQDPRATEDGRQMFDV